MTKTKKEKVSTDGEEAGAEAGTGAGTGTERSYQELISCLNPIAQPLASKKLSKKLYKCVKKGKNLLQTRQTAQISAALGRKHRTALKQT